MEERALKRSSRLAAVMALSPTTVLDVAPYGSAKKLFETHPAGHPSDAPLGTNPSPEAVGRTP
jgi:hypothetical protein